MTTERLFERLKLHGTPAANPRSIVQHGSARFTILTPRLIRLEWSSAGIFEDRATFAFPNRAADAPSYTHQKNGDVFMLETASLILCYQDDGQPFHAANLSITVKQAHPITWTPGMVNVGNLRGTARTLDQCADATRLSEGLLSREGWALYDDSGLPVWDRDQVWVEARPDDHVQDWYFFGYGRDYKAALREYTRFGGEIPRVPRFVLGAWWSRFWAYHADDLAALVREFDAHEVPLDVLVIDMDWHSPDGWTGYTWNHDLFPDPAQFLAWVHDQGLYSTLNLHPADGIRKHEAAYTRFAELLGRDPLLGDGIQFASTDKAFIQHYFELLHHPLEDQGVDFWWLDWQQGEGTDIKNLDPLTWLNHLHFRDSTRRGRRPMLYSRWGGLGNHRYPIGFSGDTYATWESLRFQPYFTATAANVGYGWWSHDIGGHFGATDPELYARWVQFGAVSPCLRLHSTKDPLAERRPWAFSDEVYRATKAAIQLRYRLLPYLYSSAQTASAAGLSLCTPMYYEYPDAEDAYLARGQYFLGDQMFVAPVTAPADAETGLAVVDVWIPDGTWIETTTRATYTGSCWVRLHVGLDHIPMFVRAGAIIPTTPGLTRTRDLEHTPLALEVFPGTAGAFDLYEDDGSTEGYLRGEYAITPLRLEQQDNQMVLHIGTPEGHCAALPPERTLQLHVKGITRPEHVTMNGVALDWDYAENDLIVSLGTVNRRAPLDIHITAQPITVAPPEAAPFVHVIDYDTFIEASQQFGTLIIAAPDATTPFDAEIVWTLEQPTGILQKTDHLRGCTGRQIVACPFADDGTQTTARWGATVTIDHGGKTFTSTHRSRATYPGVQRWQIAYPDTTVHAERPELFNIRQPFGAVLMEKEQARIKSGEYGYIEACATARLISDHEQAAILRLHAVGTHTVQVNGVAPSPIEPIPHETMQPMFNSWMPEKTAYYAITLRAGANDLSVITQPDSESGWWGVGAVIFDLAGNVLPVGGDLP
jgi:alpha-glucosidase (family GH31 glycosyl hydrolase)